MVEVSAGLWLGSEADAEALVSGGRLSKKLSVTHILSVMNQPPPDWLEQPHQSNPSPNDDVTHTADDVIQSEEKENLQETELGGSDDVDDSETSKSGGRNSDVHGEEEKTELGGSGGPKLEENSEKEIESKAVEGLRFSTMFVEASDTPRTDLLHHFERCCQFIKQGVEQGGGVMVHWYVGGL